jgi:hypothetical protein
LNRSIIIHKTRTRHNFVMPRKQHKIGCAKLITPKHRKIYRTSKCKSLIEMKLYLFTFPKKSLLEHSSPMWVEGLINYTKHYYLSPHVAPTLQIEDMFDDRHNINTPSYIQSLLFSQITSCVSSINILFGVRVCVSNSYSFHQ